MPGLAFGLAAFLAVPALAQATPDAVGKRVRIQAEGHGSITGLLAGASDADLYVRKAAAGELVTVARRDVRRIETFRRPSRKLRGLALGALAGLGVGFAAGSAGGCAPDAWLCDDSLNMAGGAVVGIPLGALDRPPGCPG
jgi:hypothetical protein